MYFYPSLLKSEGISEMPALTYHRGTSLAKLGNESIVSLKETALCSQGRFSVHARCPNIQFWDRSIDKKPTWSSRDR